MTEKTRPIENSEEGSNLIIKIDFSYLGFYGKVLWDNMNNLFSEHFESVKLLIDHVFRIIRNDRCGVEACMSDVSRFCDHLQRLSTDKTSDFKPHSQTTSRIFNEEFKQNFLLMTSDYYEKFSAENFKQKSIFEYFKLVKATSDDEQRRVQSYTHFEMCQEVRVIFEKICIYPYMKHFYCEFKLMLEKERNEDIRFLYDIVSSQDDAIRELKNIVINYLKSILLNLVNNLGDPKILDPNLFLSELGEIFKKYDHLIGFWSNWNPLFEEAKNSAFSYVINNCFDRSNNQGAPKIMAKYVHNVLILTPELCHNMRNQQHFMTLVRALDFLEDKSIFKANHLDFMASRLVENKTSLTAEREIIKLFCSTFDNDFTSDMNKMISDIEESYKLSDLFYTFCPYIGSFNSSFLILASSVWPLAHVNDVGLPHEISSMYANFDNWYSHRFNGRRIRFLDQYTRVELKISYSNSTYIFNVSGFQASVLNLFGKNYSYSYAELLKHTSHSYKTLSLTLLTLVKENIILSSCIINEDDLNNISDDTKFSINLNYYNKNDIIKIPNPLDYKTETIININRNNIMDCDLTIQAAIIRILKRERILDRQFLIHNTIEYLSRFKISRDSIIKNINTLIQREFVETNLDQNICHYIE
ncbi:hypothetical protein HZS_5740 [Henneguya salminicola]|nr:hypothetical protein HZS_5740 [Henneguya salminicola]